MSILAQSIFFFVHTTETLLPSILKPISMISACMLVRTAKGKYEDLVTRLKQIEGVKSAFPVLGRYDIVVDLESTGNRELGNTVLKVNRMAGIVFTETMPEVEI